MKNFFTTKLRTVLVIAVLCALLTIGWMLLRPGEASPMNNTVSFFSNPLKNGVSLLVDKAERLYDYMFRYERLRAENDQLREEMANKNEDIRQSQTYKEENERLRSLMDLSGRHKDYNFEIANVVSWGTTSYTSTMTISKGSSVGIEAGMCAITETGQVIGVVSEVGYNWSTITTILDSTSEIGAYVFGSGYTCIAQGSYELAGNGTLRASYLNTEATIRNGDQVLTSGDGDIYPSGLVIGLISNVSSDETNLSKYAIVTPTVDIASVEQVFIIKSYDIND